MARYWKIVDEYGITLDKNEVDKEMCAYFGEPVHKRHYHMMWAVSIVYPFLFSDHADGTFDAIRKWFSDDQALYDEHILPVIDWFKMKRYTPKQATYEEYADPQYHDKLLERQLVEN
jgi:hypothetical protein